MIQAYYMRKKRDAGWRAAVGKRLEDARKVLGVDHVDMARVANVSPQAWSNYVRGERPLSIEAASLLCDRYRLTLDWIYRGDPAGLPFELGEKLKPRDSMVVPLPTRRR